MPKSSPMIASEPLECPQRVGLSTTAVEGEHELTDKALAVRIALLGSFDLRRQIASDSKTKVEIESVLECRAIRISSSLVASSNENSASTSSRARPCHSDSAFLSVSDAAAASSAAAKLASFNELLETLGVDRFRRNREST